MIQDSHSCIPEDQLFWDVMLVEWLLPIIQRIIMPSSSGHAVQSKKSPMKTGLPEAIMILCNVDNLSADTMLTSQKTCMCKYL
jgi:hypothetical protein